MSEPGDGWAPLEARSEAQLIASGMRRGRLVLRSRQPLRHVEQQVAETSAGTSDRPGSEPGRALVDIEAVLHRLARHRTGHDEIGVAFGPAELRRIRLLLAAAARARGRAVQPRCRQAGRSHVPDDEINVVADAMAEA